MVTSLNLEEIEDLEFISNSSSKTSQTNTNLEALRSFSISFKQLWSVETVTSLPFWILFFCLFLQNRRTISCVVLIASLARLESYEVRKIKISQFNCPVLDLDPWIHLNVNRTWDTYFCSEDRTLVATELDMSRFWWPIIGKTTYRKA